MRLSTELQILIEACKISLLDATPDILEELVSRPSIHWKRLTQMAAYHKVRPILYAAFKKCSPHKIPVSYLEQYQHRALQHSMHNLLMDQETARLLNLLKKKQVRVLPYKGSLLSHKIYQNNGLREVGDIDLYLPREDAKVGLEVLLEDGYEFEFKGTLPQNISTPQLIKDVLSIYGWHEVALKKQSHQGTTFYVDFHWRLAEAFYWYKINDDNLFEHTQTLKIHHTEVDVPSDENIFLMMLVHHGGREAWLQLKSLCDLLMFFKTHQNHMDWQQLLQTAEKAKMKGILLWGTWLLEHFLDYSVPAVFSNHWSHPKRSYRAEEVVLYWEKSEVFWSQLGPKWRHTRLILSQQDTGFSKLKYFKNYLRFYATPNLLEEPRLFTFPDHMPYLNFLSKVLTFFWRKVLKR